MFSRFQIFVFLTDLYVQHYVIKFVSDLRKVGGFFPDSPVSSINKTDRHDIAEVLFKVALNTIKQTNKHRPIPF